MIRTRIHLNGECPQTLQGELRISYHSGRKEVVSDSAVSVKDAEGLCALRCFGMGVSECSFYLTDGTLVATASVVKS